ncbi:MAG: uroporphyrinogen-III synthase [Roseobacter sp.]|jgi:uroporphyrinogen-III synthase
MQKIPLILTRPADANAAFKKAFPASLAEKLDFVDCPLIRIVPLGGQVELPASIAAIFTSSNAVGYAPPGLGRRAFCVGRKTTQVAQSAGWDAVFAGLNAEELLSRLHDLRPDLPLVHLSGVHVRGEIVEKLSSDGMNARRLSLYDQELLPMSDAGQRIMEQQCPAIVPLFSPRAAAHFAAVSPVNPQLRAVAISSAVFDSLGKIAHAEILVAGQPTAQTVVECVEKLVRNISLG